MTDYKKELRWLVTGTVKLAMFAAALVLACAEMGFEYDNPLDKNGTNYRPYTLTTGVTPTGSGSVSVNPLDESYKPNQNVTVTAAAASGYKFDNWTAVSGSLPSGFNAASASVTFSISANATIQANFTLTNSGGSANIDMVSVQGGTFTMGCTSEQGSDCYSGESPPHSVTVSNFSIGKYEVTQGQWKAVMGSLPSSISSSYGMGDNYPVYYVSWNDIQTFITTLNSQTGRTYRLPTEAEWEFAARGGKNSNSYKYSGSNTLDDVAWYSGNSGSTTHIVGTKRANELGLYDMSGNVWEWVSDWYGSYNSGAQTNPTGPTSGPTSGSYRVLRGGSWVYDARYCRVSFRISSNPDRRDYDLGFRLVLSS